MLIPQLGESVIASELIACPNENSSRSDDDMIAIRPMVYVSSIFDHRILESANADHFLAKVVDTLHYF